MLLTLSSYSGDAVVMDNVIIIDKMLVNSTRLIGIRVFKRLNLCILFHLNNKIDFLFVKGNILYYLSFNYI